MPIRRTYFSGYISEEHARQAINELKESGDISNDERPAVESYSAQICAPTNTGLADVIRYRITIE